MHEEKTTLTNHVDDILFKNIVSTAMDNLLLSTSQSLSNISQNATLAQQQGQVIMQTTTALGISAILATNN
ncbi:RebB family R body protein [Vibrio owensii]|uniref:RebB family R body protein n=1 Tax=Vibrio owensii TaxID=696485 RepID=UPI0009B787D7|nr:RebB family R body protein [Vibrio owensii]